MTMRAMTRIGAVAALVAVVAGGVFAVTVALRGEPVEVSSPLYPPRGKDGQPMLASFQGRVPCDVPDCDKTKVVLVLYGSPDAGAGSYWLGLVDVDGTDDRIEVVGRWALEQGIRGYPDGLVYQLDSRAPARFQRHWRVNEDILLPLEGDTPQVGNASWGWMLSRDPAPMGRASGKP